MSLNIQIIKSIRTKLNNIKNNKELDLYVGGL